MLSKKAILYTKSLIEIMSKYLIGACPIWARPLQGIILKYWSPEIYLQVIKPVSVRNRAFLNALFWGTVFIRQL